MICCNYFKNLYESIKNSTESVLMQTLEKVEQANLNNEMICHSINYDDELVIDMHVITSNFLNSMKQDHQVTQKRNFTQAVNTRKTRPLYQQMEAAKEALECFRNGFSIGYAISSEGRINGVMSYTIDSYPDRPIVMTIWCLTKAPWQITHPSKFGIGTRLINKAIFEAKKNSVKKN